MTEIPYCTREDVMAAADFKLTARNGRKIDRSVDAGSRSVDSLCHRTFFPQYDTRKWDWPNGQYARPWRLWLDDNELISLTAVTSGGTVIPMDTVLLEPNTSGPPYNRVDLDISTTSGWIGGSTHQQDIHLTGLYGYRDDHTTVGATTTGLDAVQTMLTVTGEASAQLGIGSLLRLDGERMLVTGRRQTDTGQTLAADMDAQAKSVTVTVASGAAFAEDEAILIGGERMLIVDIAGNSLIVKRSWDGSASAPHSAGAAVYAPRTLTVTRAACGSIASTHTDSAVVERWDPPPLVRQLAIAEAIVTAGMEHSAYSQVLRSGEGDTERRKDLSGIKGLRAQTYDAHGRKARLRGV